LANELIIIENLMNEHEAISGHMRSVCSLLDAWEDETSSANLQPEQVRSLSQKGINLKQTMGYLDDGLKQHHGHEEEAMPALAGEPVMEALKIEHQEITKQMREINFILRDVQPAALVAHYDYLKLIINNLCNLVSLHTSVENTLLVLLKKRFI
jgi:hypothetical protein